MECEWLGHVEILEVEAYLGASVGSREKNAGSLTGEGGGLARVAELAQPLDDILNLALLAEASLDNSQHSGNENSLGVHDVVWWLGFLLVDKKVEVVYNESKTGQAVVKREVLMPKKRRTRNESSQN